MPVKPKIRTLTTSAADILNVIRNNASVDYRNYVPKADVQSQIDAAVATLNPFARLARLSWTIRRFRTSS